MLVNNQGLVLAVSRIDDHADLGLPGGKVEPGESYEQASIRETYEETGVKVLRQRFVYEREDQVYIAQVFQADVWAGKPRSREGAFVGWVEPEKLLTSECQFRDFNRGLFERVGLIVI